MPRRVPTRGPRPQISRSHSHRTGIMDYAGAASHALSPVPSPVPTAEPQHAHYPHPYSGYPYPYDSYYPPAPSTDPSATAAVAASSSYYYPVAAAAPASTAAAQYDPYSAYKYYAAPAGAAGAGAGGTNLAGYYFTAGEASYQPAVAQATHQSAVAATGKEAGKHLGFDPQRYAQASAARASNVKAQPVSTPGMHHAQWNAHFGHPLPKNVLRKHIKKRPKVVQPAPCEVCNIQCDTLEVLLIHKQGKKHKKNLEKLQDSITPKPVKPTSNAIGPTMAPSPVSNNTLPAVQQKKKCSSAATPEELEVKKRRVLEAGASQGEVKICNVCNVVVNSQKVYEFHIAGQKHQAMVQKQQAIQFTA